MSKRQENLKFQIVGLCFFAAIMFFMLNGLGYEAILISLAVMLVFQMYENYMSFRYEILPNRYARYEKWWGKSATIKMTYIVSLIVLAGFLALLTNYVKVK